MSDTTPPPGFRHFALGLSAVMLVAVTAAAKTLSGVCPDGSIFIVQRADAIPCRAAKLVEPGDMPPLNPELLPRPYGWEIFNRESDPNNPYNLIDSVRPAPAPRAGPGPTRGGPPPPPPRASAPPSVALAPRTQAGPAPQPALFVTLSPRELDDLIAIVAFRQEGSPATIVQRNAAGPGLQLSLARSAAFEARVEEVLSGRGTPPAGPILVFHVQASGPGTFWGNLTFVQGHMAFHPDVANAAEFGLVDGSLGELDTGERVLGYAVLPAHADTTRPLDVYWNDRMLSATLPL